MTGKKATRGVSHPALASSDRYTWTAPTPLASEAGVVTGALGGSRLFEQPKQAAEVAEFHAFLARPAETYLEIGFDHGFRLLDHAHRWPERNWVGLEVRKARVDELRARAPENLFVWRADARTVIERLVPASSLTRVDVLFPTPWWDELKRAKRILFSPQFVGGLARALQPDGVVHVATDVGPYFEHVAALFSGWQPATAPVSGDARSRREKACEREGLPVWRASWSPPSAHESPRSAR
ncbi:MAG: tRNA (guanine-N(7)-)-methyltransferase [Bradymonadia bacterium]|jgi:tRNA (guanine-N(7)-)-methyltransferase